MRVNFNNQDNQLSQLDPASRIVFPAGDALAAEYLLLQLLSRVHSRPEPIALGALSLNLTGCPSNQTTPQNSNADDSPEKLSAYTQCLSKVRPVVVGVVVFVFAAWRWVIAPRGSDHAAMLPDHWIWIERGNSMVGGWKA